MDTSKDTTLAGADSLAESQAPGREQIILYKLEIWIPAQMVNYLTSLCNTGIFGRTKEETAERLIAEGIEVRLQFTLQR